MKTLNLTFALALIASLSFAQNTIEKDLQAPPENEQMFVAFTEVEVPNRIETLSVLPAIDALETTSPVDKEFANVALNTDYLNEVQSPITPLEVREYQNMASAFDVTKAENFEGKDSPFTMVFKTEKGSITATYNNIGELMSSTERFEDVAVPRGLLAEALANFEGWTVTNSSFQVYYLKDQKAKTYYTVRITDGKKKKKVTMKEDGTIL